MFIQKHMKIDLKISVDTVPLISNILQDVYQPLNNNNINQKIIRSIGFVLADMFDKKHKNLIKKNDLFQSAKPIKIGLKYHEAWALKGVLMNEPEIKYNPLHNALLRKTIHQLDQKLQ